MQKVVVYGGGNIAHSLAAVISATQQVFVVTRRPNEWHCHLKSEKDGVINSSKFFIEATDNHAVIEDADVLFICLPQFLIDNVLERVFPHLNPRTVVVFVPAPAKSYLYAEILRKKGIRVIGFQRVPFISRIIKYGRSVKISNNREIHKIAVSNDKLMEFCCAMCDKWFGGSIVFLSSFLTFSFSNSNPLLHPSRLIVLFDKWREKKFTYNPPFYGEWTDASSELYLAADYEMKCVMQKYSCFDMLIDYESVLDHYNVKNAHELTLKLQSISSFREILSPMKKQGELWVPDFESRYFTEDVNFGLRILVEFAEKNNVPIPIIQGIKERMREICFQG